MPDHMEPYQPPVSGDIPRDWNWDKIRRPDRQMLVEFICGCGTGHPAYGSALWISEDNAGADSPDLEDELSAQLVHGCCGCCKRKDFPGTPIGSLKYSHKLIRELIRRYKELEEQCATSSTPKSSSRLSTIRTWLRSLLSRSGLLRR